MVNVGVSANTDGLIVKLDSLDKYELIDDICYEWECMTGVSLTYAPLLSTSSSSLTNK